MSAPPVHKLDSATDERGAKTDDVTITAQVDAALAGDPKLGALKIDVDTVGDHVNLAGVASDAASRTRVTESAQTVKGVVSVDSKFEVR